VSFIKYNKLLIITLSCLFIVLKVVGTFLTLNFLPIQDPETLTMEEKFKLQKEFSINYDLGNSMINLSKLFFVVLIAYSIYSFYVFWRITHSDNSDFIK